MSIERDRLLSLVEFAQQSARLRSKTVARVAEHGLFLLYEHEIRDLPGIRLNVGGNNAESQDEIWLAVARLSETSPPEITSAVLRPWVQVTHNPTDEPRLLESIEEASLITASTHRVPTTPHEHGEGQVDPAATINLSDYDAAAQVRAQFATYVDTKWRPWSTEEKLRRDSIRLYTRLFTLKQQLEGGIIETQIELVWGIGLGI